MPLATIGDVLEELDRAIEWAKRDGHRAGYFAVLYREVTERVRDGIRDGRFEDGARMERLDVIFAGRYLDALAAYRRGDAPTRSWEVAFRGAERWRPIVLQHLLTGMNAHINLDLAIAAAETAPGAALARLRSDFDEITLLLGEMLDEIQDRISRISPWLWLVDRVGARDDEAIFSFALGKARRVAWAAAESLARNEDAVDHAQIEATDLGTARIGHRILRPGPFVSLALLGVRSREPGDAGTVIEALSG